MCVIIHKPKGVEFTPEDVAGAFNANSHGFGVMYFDHESGEVIAKKKLTKDLLNIKEIFKDLTEEDAVFHFRIKTHGPTNDMFCHPFQVLNKKEHGHDLWLMHNGIISKARNSSNESDTYAYCRDVLTKQLAADIDRLQDDWFKEKVEGEIGGSKFVFLDGTGKITVYNKKMGDDYKGCWVSNKSFVNYSSRVWDSITGKFKDDYPPADWPRRTYHGNRNNKSEPDTGSKSSSGAGDLCRLRGVEVRPGSKVHMFNVVDPTFYAVGSVASVEAGVFHVQYTDPKNNANHFALFYGNGETGENSIRKLQCVPECFGIEQVTSVFMESKFWPKDQDDPKQATLMLEDRTQTKEKMMTTEKKETATMEEAVETTYAEVDGVAVVHEGNPTIEYVGTKPIEIIMDFKDCRWGGWDGGIEAFTVYGGTLDPECPEITLLDIYNMEPQDRIEWFFRYPQSAFGIFQDLIEQVVSEDPEVLHEGEEEPSVEESREAMLA